MKDFLKKKHLIVLLLFLMFLLFFLNLKKRPFFIFKIKGKTYKLLVAKDPKDWQKGLMFYRSKKELNGAEGMIFLFPNKNYQIFWNKNTFLDLDIYWIDGEKIIGKSFLPSIKKTKNIFTVTSPKLVDKVVEIIR